MSQVTLDEVKKIGVQASEFKNELSTLEYLRYGLLQLEAQVRALEEVIRKEESESKRQITFFGSYPGISRETQLILPCLFHWYCVSLCNYARLVGYVATVANATVPKAMPKTNSERKAVKKACDDYVKSVTEISEVVRWRNKVAGHFAVTDPYEEDNAATLDMSVVLPVGYSNGRYRVGVMAMVKTGPDGTPQTSDLPEWSVTEVTENLSPRYWKHSRLC
jgi:hypothetical protein